MAVGAAFPIAKLGFLLIRQVSKPIAKSIAERAKKSPVFANWICKPVAQLFHFYEVKVKMRALNLSTGKVTKVPKLSETQAVQQGAEILSEVIILSIASAILIYEYNRQKEKEEAKEDKVKADREAIKNKIYDLELKVERQSVQIRNLAKTAINLEEEIQKKSLKRLLGQNVEVSEELVKTMEENSEVPKEVKPLEWLVDKVEEIDNKKANEAKQEVTNSKTPVQEVVEKHYAKVRKSDDTETDTANAVKPAEKSSQSREGVITGSLSYLLGKN